MPQVYEVQYQINVNSAPALAAIQQFQEATLQLEQLTRRFDKVSNSIGKLNSAFQSIKKTPTKVNIDVSNAQAGLNNILNLMQSVQANSKKLSASLSAVKAPPVNVTVNTGQAETNLGRVITMMKAIQMHATSTVSIPNISQLNKQLSDLRIATAKVNKNRIKPKAETKRANDALDALIRRLQIIKNNKNIVITATAPGVAGAVGRGTSTTAAAMSTRGRGVRSAPRAPGALYPSTRQVLGPLYADSGTNIVGSMVKGMGVAYGLSAFMSGISNVFSEATDYQNISQTTKNILGAHDKRFEFESDFNQMNKLMRQVGVETKYKATDVAAAGKFLAMAGLRTDDIKESIRPISNLALIGDNDLGETADVVTNIMTGYEISASKMNNVADILTMTFTKSNTTLMELAESFKYAGTVAKQSGLEFETTAAAVGVLGDAGIKASHAGTTLRMMLMNMQAPTKKQAAAWKALGVSPKDENGNLRDFGTLMSELNAKSKEMSSGDFTSLFYQAFRITAATGALALVRNADKLRDLTDLNKTKSVGLSGELAESKKNTIEGLWYQFTSAFTESGMKGFEAMQGKIESFLKRMIALMKSPEFVEALSSAMEVFLKLTQAVASAFKFIVSIWNAVPNWAKDAFIWFAKIQMIFGIISSTVKTVLSTLLLGKSVLLGGWVASIGKVLLGMKSILLHVVQIYGFARFAGLSKVASVGQAIGRGLFGSIAGGAVGSAVAGTAAAGAGGGTVAGGITALGLLSKAGAYLFTNPFGWASMAALAIGTIGYKVYDTYQKTQQAAAANREWAESFNKLGVDRMNFEEKNSLMIGNMRIFNNQLTTHQQKVAQATDLWNRYWDAVNNKDNVSNVKDKTKFVDVDTPEAKWYKQQIDRADSWFGHEKVFGPLMDKLGGTIMPFQYADSNGKRREANMLSLSGGLFDIRNGSGINENAAVQLMFAKLAADPNNKRVQELQNYLLTQLSGAHNYQDFQNIKAQAERQFLPNVYQTRYNRIGAAAAADMTFEDIENTQAYVRTLRQRMEVVFDSWNVIGELFKNYDKTNTVDENTIKNAQIVLQNLFGNLFNAEYGVFGSNGYIKKIQEIANNPTKYGYANVKSFTSMVNKSFDDLLQWYGTLDNHYKPLFAHFLNRSPLEAALPDGHFTTDGGYKSPTKLGQTMTVDGVTYKSEFNGAMGTYRWVDKTGKLYTPKDAKSPFASVVGGSTGGSTAKSIHNGSDQSQYKSHYSQSAAPKQVIVKIENLMRVDRQTIDMTDDRQVAAINNIKQELATALLDVVQDFNANIV